MSADVLRQAAAYMRDEANTIDLDALFHPEVAIAVADWLDATAARVEVGKRNHSWRGSTEALAVARAYLGSKP